MQTKPFTKLETVHKINAIITATLNSVKGCEPFFRNFLYIFSRKKVPKNPSQLFTPFTEKEKCNEIG
jgi:hypothetical protein